jgi:hypothetical protein
MSGLWDAYREELQRLIVDDGPEPEDVSMYEELYQDNKAELERYRRGLAADLAERQGRPAKEEPQIVQAEQAWALKIRKQQQNQEMIECALVELFRDMARLEHLEIQPWYVQKWQGLDFERQDTHAPDTDVCKN